MIRTCLIALLCAGPAVAQQSCAERSQVVQKLEERFGETLRSMGLHQNDGVVEVYSNETTGTWTILMSRPDGTSCLLAAGRFWEQDAQPLGPQGQPL